MTLPKLETFPAKILKGKAKPLSSVTREDRIFFDVMLDVMQAQKGIGLAAPQVGVGKSMLVVDIGNGPIKLANPAIIKKSGSAVMEEGCLSCPDISVNVRRAKVVKVKALDENSKEITIEAKGLYSRALQHEIDHLNGILIIDYLNPISKLKAKIKLKRLQKLNLL